MTAFQSYCHHRRSFLAARRPRNHNLLNVAQEIFDSEVARIHSYTDSYKKSSLLGIADYLNGVAMQKYPTLGSEDGLPVLKIKELGQQFCDSTSDRCTKNIPDQYVVHDGDIVFSWSGTLLVDFWCGAFIQGFCQGVSRLVCFFLDKASFG